jgi:hypothetical protein
MITDVRQTFEAVLRCPNPRMCIEDKSVDHPCREIVEYQLKLTGAKTYADFQLPEPWCGQIDRAPILFVSSNPSLGDSQPAFGNVSDEDAFDSHHFVFGGGRGTYTRNGVNPVDADGKQSKAVHFWSAVCARVKELIPDRPVAWGEDYALTEIVRCKSKHEEGVVEALEECTRRYFDRTMAVAAARVVVAIGKARGHIRKRYEIAESDMLATIEIAGKSRLIAFLPAPSSFGPGLKTFTGLYSPKDLQRLRETVAG